MLLECTVVIHIFLLLMHSIIHSNTAKYTSSGVPSDCIMRYSCFSSMEIVETLNHLHSLKCNANLDHTEENMKFFFRLISSGCDKRTKAREPRCD